MTTRSDSPAMQARAAARRLSGLAGAVLLIVSIVAAVAGVIAIGGLLTTDDSHVRAAFGITLGAAVILWASVALVCFAARALARYIEFRTSEGGPTLPVGPPRPRRSAEG